MRKMVRHLLIGGVCFIVGCFCIGVMIVFPPKKLSYEVCFGGILGLFLVFYGLFMISEGKHKEEKLSSIAEFKEGKGSKIENIEKLTKILIAHYDTSNISISPLGTLHDSIGAPILEKNEQIIGITKKIRIDVPVPQKKVHEFAGYHVFDDLGKGTLYRTNQRLIYIREPMARWKNIGGPPIDAMRRFSLAEDWNEKNWKECISIPLSTIKRMQIRKISRKISIELFAENVPWDIVLYPSYRVHPLIKDLLEKNNAFEEKQVKSEIRSDNKYGTTLRVVCPYCQTSFQITPTAKPFKVKCPSCTKESLFR